MRNRNEWIGWAKESWGFVLLCWLGLLSCVGVQSGPASEPTQQPAIEPKPELPVVSRERLHELRAYAAASGDTQRIGLFADLAIPSYKERFFIVELASGTVLASGLVTHGHCQESEVAVRLSNVPGSNCSSEGKYRVGKPYMGTFGLAFKLHGLDETNSNAYERFIVMHAHDCVPNEEVESEICESEGCPTLSPDMLTTTQALITNESLPVLLWVYRSDEPAVTL